MKFGTSLAALLAGLGLLWPCRPVAASAYGTPDEVGQRLARLADAHSSRAALRKLAESPGGRPLWLLEIAASSKDAPAVLVVANMEGNAPLATAAALELTRLLLADWSEWSRAYRWYLMPLGNPDGYAHFFARPRTAVFLNQKPHNDDADDATDEDGPDDLDGDGYITSMRQKHPEGEWLPVENNPVLLRKADRAKGETGIYRLFSEGLDNDGDGSINEDGIGGANPGRNFPHRFQHYTTTDGAWAASEAETRGLLEFAYARPEIALVLALGRANSLKTVPEGSQKVEAAQSRYKLPKRFAEQMGVSPDEEFPLSELVEMGREFTGYQGLTEEMVLQWLGVGAAVKPDAKDLPYWKEVSDRYNAFLKEKGFDSERLAPPEFAPGSLDEWAYYQFGVPSFSMDFWTVPVKRKESKVEKDALGPDELEKMSNEEFIALGPEKIAAFLKANEAPAQYTAEMVIMGLKGGMMTTAMMADFIRKAKKKKEAGGADETELALYEWRPDAFVAWTAYRHPLLGDVEIGGLKPWSELAPDPEAIDSLVQGQLPFVRQLVEYLPRLNVARVDVEPRAADVWSIDAWVTNEGFLPYPTHQGKRSERPTPAVVTLSGDQLVILEGRARQVLDVLEGSGQAEKVSWLVLGRPGQSVKVRAESASAGKAERELTLKGGAR